MDGEFLPRLLVRNIPTLAGHGISRLADCNCNSETTTFSPNRGGRRNLMQILLEIKAQSEKGAVTIDMR